MWIPLHKAPEVVEETEPRCFGESPASNAAVETGQQPDRCACISKRSTRPQVYKQISILGSTLLSPTTCRLFEFGAKQMYRDDKGLGSISRNLIPWCPSMPRSKSLQTILTLHIDDLQKRAFEEAHARGRLDVLLESSRSFQV